MSFSSENHGIISRIKNFIITSISAELLTLPNFTPVLMGIGILAYFSLSTEPKCGVYIAGFLISLLMAIFRKTRIVGIFLSLILLGFLCSYFRTNSIRIDMLSDKAERVDFIGTVVSSEKSPNGAKLIVSDVEFLKCAQEEDLNKLRNTKIGRLMLIWKGEKAKNNLLKPGDRIQTFASLDPIYPKSFPNAYDFRKQSFFNYISGRGYIMYPPKIIGENTSQIFILKNKIRNWIDTKICSVLEPRSAAIAMALITGNKSLIDKETRNNFADSGLAHILAISGLHVGIIAGFFFFLLRRGTVLISPVLVLKYDIKKIAALLSLFFVFLYLQISGESIPSIRAFLMYSLIVVAILLDRKAISMRSVAIAATLIMLFYPESILFPSFQMSFGAVVAIIALYENIGHMSKVKTAFYSLLMTSTVATLATSIFSVYTFNKFSIGALVSNIVAVPLMSFVVMPMAIVSMVFIPIGVGKYPLKIFEVSIKVLLKIADSTASCKWSSFYLSTPDIPSMLWIISGGLLVTLMYNKRNKLLGIPCLVIGLISYCCQKIPDIYISFNREVIGINMGNYMCFNNLRTLRSTSTSFAQTLGIKDKFNFSHKKCRECISDLQHGVYEYRIKDRNILLINRKQCQDDLSDNNAVVIEFNNNASSNRIATLIYLDDEVQYETIRIQQRPWS